jgi:hypothetical protein
MVVIVVVRVIVVMIVGHAGSLAEATALCHHRPWF